MMAALLQSDLDESDFEVEQVDNGDSDNDISISTVNTEDLSDLSFLKDAGKMLKLVEVMILLW